MTYSIWHFSNSALEVLFYTHVRQLYMSHWILCTQGDHLQWTEHFIYRELNALTCWSKRHLAHSPGRRLPPTEVDLVFPRRTSSHFPSCTCRWHRRLSVSLPLASIPQSLQVWSIRSRSIWMETSHPLLIYVNSFLSCGDFSTESAFILSKGNFFFLSIIQL